MTSQEFFSYSKNCDIKTLREIRDGLSILVAFVQPFEESQVSDNLQSKVIRETIIRLQPLLNMHDKIYIYHALINEIKDALKSNIDRTCEHYEI